MSTKSRNVLAYKLRVYASVCTEQCMSELVGLLIDYKRKPVFVQNSVCQSYLAKGLFVLYKVIGIHAYKVGAECRVKVLSPVQQISSNSKEVVKGL